MERKDEIEQTHTIGFNQIKKTRGKKWNLRNIIKYRSGWLSASLLDTSGLQITTPSYRTAKQILLSGITDKYLRHPNIDNAIALLYFCNENF